MDNTYEIYQLKNNESIRDLRFERYSHLEKMGKSVDKENYDLIYTMPLKNTDTLDSIYEKFNLYHPEDFRGHSLSVSDVVVFHEDGRDTAYYVDSFGFRKIPEFFKTEEVKAFITEESEGVYVEGHTGTWHTIEKQVIDGKDFFLMEHDLYGDDAASIIIDNRGILYAEDLFDGFSKEVVEMIQEIMTPVDIFPDKDLRPEDLIANGFVYEGMLPVSENTALKYLYSDDLQLYGVFGKSKNIVIDDMTKFNHHKENHGMFAVDKLDWMRYLENGEYLRSAEMSSEQNYNMIDGRNNNEPTQKFSLLERLSEKKEQIGSKGKLKYLDSKSSDRDMT